MVHWLQDELNTSSKEDSFTIGALRISFRQLGNNPKWYLSLQDNGTTEELHGIYVECQWQALEYYKIINSRDLAWLKDNLSSRGFTANKMLRQIEGELKRVQ
jgi:hypothetical protein